MCIKRINCVITICLKILNLRLLLLFAIFKKVSARQYFRNKLKYFHYFISVTAPPGVINLTNTSTDARSISLQWQRPATNCPITGYFISYDGATMWGDNSPDAGSDKILVTDDNGTVTYTLTSLVPYSNYNVQVWGENLAGSGTNATLADIKTEEAGE